MKLNLKSPKLKYIPWTAVGMVIGMWAGAAIGQRLNPDEYMVYSACGLGVGLIFGNAFEHALKNGGKK